ncbi:MAG: AI-2E family transporter [Ruminococcaceae bacterium]|nr:AI-2E family transporter [Oscillospiraceae bacterium]
MKKLEISKQTAVKILSSVVVVAIGLLLYFFIQKFDEVKDTLGKLLSLLSPFLIGFALAYILNIPVMFFDKKLFSFCDKGKPRPKLRRILSITLTIILLLTLTTAAIAIVLPQIYDSLVSLANNIESYINSLDRILENFFSRSELFQNFYNGLGLQLDKLFTNLENIINSAVPWAINFSKQLISGIADSLIGLVISVYFLYSKEKILAKAKKFACSVLSEKQVCTLLRVADASNVTFSRFITGKLLTSVIMTVICYIGMIVLRMPYPLLIALVVGITDIIPYFGPFIGSIPSAVLIFLVSPGKVIWFILFILAVQQLEGNIITPKVIGDITGISPFWVIFAILVGGDLFGFVGMFIGVPIFAILYTFMREYFNRRLIEKGLPINTREYASEKNPIEF